MKYPSLQGGNAFTRLVRTASRQKYLLLMTLPALILIILFNYIPYYGVIIAFKNFKIGRTITNSPWVGLRWFDQFFRNPYWWRITSNTFLLGFYSLIFGFPAPVILALLLNELRSSKFKKTIQTISYLPYFISTVIIVGILKELTASNGPINGLIRAMGGQTILFFTEPGWFRTLFISSGIWQGLGWGSIIYLAALAGVDPQLYEAATIDGASRWRKAWNITLPSIKPTITVLLILNIGGILGADSQKVLLMYNAQTYVTADIIGTYVYREGVQGMQYSYTTAIGLMMSVFSFALVFLTNMISRRMSGESLW